jgi:hypothetical protein
MKIILLIAGVFVILGPGFSQTKVAKPSRQQTEDWILEKIN